MNTATSHRHLAHVKPLIEDPIVFFTATTSKRRQFLNCAVAHRILQGVWAASSDRNGWFVGDYLLMPEHIHLFARPSRSAESMGKWVGLWKSISSRSLIAELGLDAPVWQKDYFDRYLRSAESYAEKWAYVELNPVQAGLVAQPGDWPYRGRIHELRW